MQIALIVISVLFIICILIQQKESSLGSMAGTDTGNTIVQGRRGFEKTIHTLSVILFALLLAGGLYLMITAA